MNKLNEWHQRSPKTRAFTVELDAVDIHEHCCIITLRKSGGTFAATAPRAKDARNMAAACAMAYLNAPPAYVVGIAGEECVPPNGEWRVRYVVRGDRRSERYERGVLYVTVPYDPAIYVAFKFGRRFSKEVPLGTVINQGPPSDSLNGVINLLEQEKKRRE